MYLGDPHPPVSRLKLNAVSQVVEEKARPEDTGVHAWNVLLSHLGCIRVDVITVEQSLAHMHMMSAAVVHAGLYNMGVNATCNAGAEEIERLPKPSGAARAAWLAQKEKYNIEDADPERRRARLERKMRRQEKKIARRRTGERGPVCAAESDDSSL